ncbi:MAG TPA: ATP-binding protein [Acidimicrobiales bacterium]|nr:ATP-binding protein [Acidimicrobiales bacterium]
MGDRPGRREGTVLLERVATLPAERVSPREARRLLREAAMAVGRAGWLDAGELAISEVVTNAVLHAHSGVTVRVAIYEDGIVVEVHDGNPTLPLARDYDSQASTGRGLGLVAALSQRCGVDSLGTEGKVVWFCISDAAEEASDEAADPSHLLDAWAVELDGPDDASGLVASTANVVLPHLPPTLWLSAREHHDALLRELTLYAAEHRVETESGDDLEVLLVRADAARSLISGAVVRAVEEAHVAGRTRSVLPPGHPSPLPWVPDDLDLELCVDVDDAPNFLALADVLDLAERLAVDGRLLARPGLPEIIAVRDWACDSIVAQLGGSPPAPWGGTAQERFETESHGRAIPEDFVWDVASVRDSTEGVVAADDANRIIAVSAPLAELLGWDRDALVGRRVVTLIPPRLREAHVAGFSRHLSTGEAHVLGVPLELPVLHADGREILCHFLVERAAVERSRTVYRAWIEPVETAGGATEPVSTAPG